jgi:hypothetical protein
MMHAGNIGLFSWSIFLFISLGFYSVKANHLFFNASNPSMKTDFIMDSKNFII